LHACSAWAKAPTMQTQRDINSWRAATRPGDPAMSFQDVVTNDLAFRLRSKVSESAQSWRTGSLHWPPAQSRVAIQGMDSSKRLAAAVRDKRRRHHARATAPLDPDVDAVGHALAASSKQFRFPRWFRLAFAGPGADRRLAGRACERSKRDHAAWWREARR